MTPETDILIPAVLPLKDRCSLNFHFWPPGPWDPCYFHLRESFFSCSLPALLSLPLSPACRERARKKHTGLQLFIQSIVWLHILVSYFSAINRRPLPPLTYRKSLSITLICSRKKNYLNLNSASVKRTPFYIDPVMHANQCCLRKANWKCLPYHCLHVGYRSPFHLLVASWPLRY